MAETFSYQAQTPSGQPIAGTLAAANLDAARQALQSINLRIISLTAEPRPAAEKTLRSTDFMAFNQQLACLTSAGLPVEQGLRLIASDLRSGRLASAVRGVADDLALGVALPEAFARRERQFPTLYSRLIDAGIKANNLPAMLFNLGRHLELVSRVRCAIWRAIAYPMVILAGITTLLIFLSIYVLPHFREIFADFRTKLPALTIWLMNFGDFFPPIGIGILALLIIGPLVWAVVRFTPAAPHITDQCVLPIPILGSILRANMLSRWCDALRLAVEAGLDLPRGFELAAAAVGSPRLSRETDRLTAFVRAGQPLEVYQPADLMPQSLITTLHLTSQNHDLGESLHNLADLYEQQAELRLRLLPLVITPTLMIFAATMIGFMVVGLFLPLVQLVTSVSGGP